ncbi:MAG: hypothetical protein JNL39_03150 [Opitutaceae bacterium]|nr:hypothetical protein [Opitutaceae bacterium]
MKTLAALACLAAAFAHAALAGPNEAAIMAAMKLSDAPSYAWTASVSDDARTYDIIGRTSRAGYSRVRMPLINSVRRRLGRTTTEVDADYVFRGNVACVIETENGWKKPDELRDEDQVRRREVQGIGPTGHAPITVGSPIGVGPPPGRRGRGGRGGRPDAAYSNIQLGLSLPHEELAVIVSSHTHLQVEGDIATGTLNDLGAQLLLVRDGQEAITPVRAAGTFKLWLQGGAVVKYQVKVEGILSVEANGSRRQVVVQQTTDTIIREVGTAVVDVPEQARLKLRG